MNKQTASWPKENFLLQNKTAIELYEGFAKEQPIIDYHCHLPPQEIAENKQFSTITEIWLKGDHYKWRALRALGVDEDLITGNSTYQEKFMAWAGIVPKTVRNPLFHWTAMELANPFGIHTPLNAQTAASVYEETNSRLAEPGFRTQQLIANRKVQLVGTTDDPCDQLQHHKAFASSGAAFKMLPSFRPDAVWNFAQPAVWLSYIEKLATASGQSITNLDELLAALDQRIIYFHAAGCRVSDHGLTQMPWAKHGISAAELNKDFQDLLKKKDYQAQHADALTSHILLHLCKRYQELGWVQQFHLGAIRNLNSRIRTRVGADSGVDSIGDDQQAIRLSAFLDELDRHDQLAKTILYNLNPALNEVFAALAGTFNDGSMAGKIQFGSAWWFLDQLDGMEKQLNSLSTLGILSTFIGMTTDSRSFLSYSRHDYFRRLLCNLFGTDIENGLLPNDINWMGGIIADICYHNAKKYFFPDLE